MKIAHRRAARSGGFTLVEILVAMGILLFGLTSVLGLLSFGAALSRAAALRGDASSAVEAIVADLEERMFPLVVEKDEVRAGEPVAIEQRPVPGFPGLEYSAHATLDQKRAKELGPPFEYRVDVEVAWTSAGRRKSRTFTALLLREIPFGEQMRRLFVAPQTPAAPAAK